MRNKTILYLIIANVLFISYYIIILFSIDVAFFYRFDNDPFNYYVMSKSLAETGSTNVSIAEGVPSITYTKIPAYVRFPIFMIFKDLDSRIRALQLFNLVILVMVANIFWIYLNITMPSSWNRIFTFLPFIYLTINPWLSNVTTTLSDTIMALQFYMVILIVKKCDYREVSFKRALILIIALTALLWSVIMLKFTAGAALLVFIFIYFYQSRSDSQEGMEHHNLIKLIIPISIAVVIALLVNLHLIIFYIKVIYNTHIANYPMHVVIIRSASILIFSAIPTQIIPYFNGIFINPQNLLLSFDLSQLSIDNFVWLISGLGISTIIVMGLWQLRWHMTAEIGCLLMLLIYAITPISAPRYLTVVQPFLWIFFLQGLAVLIDALQIRLRLIVPSLIGLLILIAIAVQVQYAKNVSEWSYYGKKPRLLIDYIRNVSTNYRNARNFIESLPKNHTLFVLTPDTSPRWFALLDIKYITEDSIYAKLKDGYDVYIVVEFTRRKGYGTFDNTQLFLKNLIIRENITNRPVFVQESDAAKIIIYKLSL